MKNRKEDKIDYHKDFNNTFDTNYFLGIDQENKKSKKGRLIYDAILFAKREYHINNIALDVKIHNMKNRNHNIKKIGDTGQKSRWRLIKIIFVFTNFLNRQLNSKKISGLSIENQYLFNESEDEDENGNDETIMINNDTLQWIGGQLPINSYRITTRKKYLIYEDSLFFKIWTHIIIILFFYIAIFLPYRIAFINKETVFLHTLEIIVTTLFIVDIIITFFTAYSEDGIIVDDLKKIFYNYAKSWLILDVFSILPFDLFLQSSNGRLNNFTKLLRIVKLARILRIIKISDRVSKNKITKKIYAFFNINRQFSDLLTFVVLIILLAHITSCLWYFLASISDTNTWIDNVYDTSPSDFEKYIASFYWTFATICTAGFGDIVPINMLEKLFSLVWIAVGVAFYSYTIGTLSSLLSSINEKKSIISNRFAFLSGFAKEKKLDKKILERITINLEFLEETKKYSEDDLCMNFLNDIPVDYTLEIVKDVHKELIEKIVIFDETNINFIAHMIPFLKFQRYRPGEIIYKIDEYPHFIYFIMSGRVGVFNDSNILYNTYTEGSYFGEIEIFRSCRRYNKIKTLTETKLYLLPNDIFVKRLEDFAELSENLYKNAMLRDICNKRFSEYFQRMRFITLNNVLKEDDHDELIHYNKNCYDVIQEFKYRINNFDKYSEIEFKPAKTISNEQIQERQGTLMTKSLEAELSNYTVEPLEMETNKKTDLKFLNLKKNFSNLYFEIQENNNFLRFLLGQCLGQDIECAIPNQIHNKGTQCNFDDDHHSTYSIIKESKNNNISDEDINKSYYSDKNHSNYQTSNLLANNELSENNKRSLRGDLSNDKLLVKNNNNSSDAIKIHKVNLFDDPELKKICKNKSMEDASQYNRKITKTMSYTNKKDAKNSDNSLSD